MSGYMKGGLRDKYSISKNNGKEIDPDAKYFVLRVDKDPHALNALKTYGLSVFNDNPQLSDEIGKLCDEMRNLQERSG